MLIGFVLCVAFCLWLGASRFGLWVGGSTALVVGSIFASEISATSPSWLIVLAFALPFPVVLFGWAFLGGRSRSAARIARIARNRATYLAAYRGKSDI